MKNNNTIQTKTCKPVFTHIRQGGFSLIELMIVVTIISILISIVLPTYQSFIIKAKITEGLVLANACMRSLDIDISPGPGNYDYLQAADIDSCKVSGNLRYTEKVVISHVMYSRYVVVQVTLANTGYGPVNGAKFGFYKDFTDTRATWQCATDAPWVLGTKALMPYLPKSLSCQSS